MLDIITSFNWTTDDSECEKNVRQNMVADSNAWIVRIDVIYFTASWWTKLLLKQEANHLVIDPEHIGDVDADINGVDLVGVGEVELVVVLDRGF